MEGEKRVGGKKKRWGKWWCRITGCRSVGLVGSLGVVVVGSLGVVVVVGSLDVVVVVVVGSLDVVV